ncbi:MAG TPA: Sec-independent protein translocase subunit TatB [Micromonosporaceae bacterium]|jgi:sec-independent protein translocase protein TatB
MEFFGINGWEFVVLLLLAMFIFGPDRLPKAIADGVKMLRNLRDLARNATGDLSRELGTDISLEDLHPKTLIRKHILSEEDEAAIRQPLDALYRDVRSDLKGVRGGLDGVHGNIKNTVNELNPRKPVNPGGPTAAPPTEPATSSRYAFDDDAT